MKKLLSVLVCAGCVVAASAQASGLAGRVAALTGATQEHDMLIGEVKVKSLILSGDTLKVDFNENFSYNYLTPEMIDRLKADIKAEAAGDCNARVVQITVEGDAVENFFFDFDKKYARKHESFITENDANRRYSKALDGNLIAMWHSHGLYYEPKINCWEWQRPRLFETIEDLYPMSYVLPYVMPMLENAGAYVFNPRERDTHSEEQIVDADGGLAQATYAETNGAKAWSDAGTGFAYKHEVYKDFDNPFADGSARQIEAVKKGAASIASYDVTMQEAGDYAIYVSYKTLPNSVNDAQYTVNASGITRTFTVNQRMAGGVWNYLGTFPLQKGLNKDVVTVSNLSKCKGGVVTTDAIKVGGGMGNVARCAAPDTEENRARAGNYANCLQKPGIDYKYITSGFPRFVEGSRSNLQWMGFPDSVYTLSHGIADYADDFRSRSEWVNCLAGGSQAMPGRKGLNVPLDLSFAFHTDAGVTQDDGTIGTLSIYRSNGFSKYADGTPRIISRYLADMVGRQLIDDARAKFDPAWTNRGLTQENLYEIRVPQIPGMLLEYLSHQNFADMRLGLDPDFIFSSSRAIYKGILKFIGKRDHRDVVVQPLPVNSFAMIPYYEGDFKLLWAPTPDSLETTAMPTKYIVQERIGSTGNAFKDIAVVTGTEYMVKVTDNQIHSYRIVALNDGGRSFPSETLSLGVAPQSKGMANVVNAFTRVSAPDWTVEGDIATFTDETDHGVPYIQGINYIGSQYLKRRSDGWSDARGGFGSSHSDYEGAVIAGNTFDFPAVHGESLLAAGYSFISNSVKAVEQGVVTLEGYDVIDIIAGKQKETKVGYGAYPSKYRLFSKPLMEAIEAGTRHGGSVLLTGAYVGSDIFDHATPNEDEVRFAKEVLGYTWGGSQASCTGEVYTMYTTAHQVTGDTRFSFNNTLNRDIYCVETPNSIFASDGKGFPFMRYKENNRNAAILSNRDDYRTAIIGFPFETITSREVRDQLMKQILNYFETK